MAFCKLLGITSTTWGPLDSDAGLLGSEAFKNVLAVRAEIEGTWGGKPPSPERYYDLSYQKKALALLDRR